MQCRKYIKIIFEDIVLLIELFFNFFILSHKIINSHLVKILEYKLLKILFVQLIRNKN